MMKIIYILLFLFFSVNAKILISPQDSMKIAFGDGIEINKKNIILKKDEAKKVQKSARVKLDSKIFRIYTAVKDSHIIGYGILVNQKVRSKNAVIMYHITDSDTLKSIEIISFNEPIEYLPSDKWNEQFDNKDTNKMLNMSKDIPTISGATLSAKAVIDASKIAFGVYKHVLKGK